MPGWMGGGEWLRLTVGQRKLPLLSPAASCFLLILLLAMAGPAMGATITIDTTTPGGIAGAIAAAGAGDTIILNPGTYTETGITVDRSLTIRANTSYGGTAANTIIDGSNTGLIMSVNAGVTLTLDSLTFTRGQHSWGGAIVNSGTLTVTSSSFTSCSAPGPSGGGAIYNTEILTVTSSSFTSCSASGSAGGGAILNGEILTVTSSSFSSCSGVNGGAISNYDYLTVTSSTFSACTATSGGGAIYSSGTQTVITSSTFTTCFAAGNGGAIVDSGILTVRFSRFYGNTAGSSGPAIRQIGGATDITDNWWGTNSDPAADLSGPVPYTPWLMLNATATPASITSAQTSLIEANLTFDSAGTNTIGSGHVPDGTPVTFAIVSGSGTLSTAATTTTNGVAGTTFTPTAIGNAVISATVDGQTVNVPVVVSQAAPVAAFTGTPTTGTAPLTVQFNETSTNTPTSWNWSFGDGSAWFNTTSAAQRNATHTYAAAGTYSVTLVAGNAGGSGTLTRADYINLTAAPAPPAPGPVTTTQAPGYDPPASDAGDGGSGSGSGPASSPSSGTASVKIGGNSAAGSALVTGTGIKDLIVTGTTRTGTNVPPPPGTVYQYIGLVPARFTSITSAAITFTIPASWLEEHGIPPENIVLYHYENGQWTALPTTMSGTQNGIVTFTATSPGFSLFAIAGVPETPAAPEMKTIGDLAAGSGPAPEGPSGTEAPLVTQTTAAPVPDHGQAPDIPVPLLAIAGLVILAAGGFVVRRFWIRRQNPALFEEYD